MNHFTTVNVKRNSGEKELKRAKQAGQQRASGSNCNLAVNRMLTTKQDLPAWIDKLRLRRRTTTNNAMNCPDGVSAFNNRDQMKRYDQGLKCAGSQRVEDPALSNVPGLFVYSFTVSPVAVIEPDIYGLNNETTERRAGARRRLLALYTTFIRYFFYSCGHVAYEIVFRTHQNAIFT